MGMGPRENCAENNAEPCSVQTALAKAYGPSVQSRDLKQQPNVQAKWAELHEGRDLAPRKLHQGNSGFATPPGSTSAEPQSPDACADALSKIIADADTRREVTSEWLGRSGEDLSDVARCPDVASHTVNQFDGRNLLWRSDYSSWDIQNLGLATL